MPFILSRSWNILKQKSFRWYQSKTLTKHLQKRKNFVKQIQTKNTKDISVPVKDNFILHLRTPLRIKKSKKLVTQIDNKNIANIFGIKSSENIEVMKVFERWIDFQRFSHRQKTSMRMGGLIGKYELFDPCWSSDFSFDHWTSFRVREGQDIWFWGYSYP